MRSHSMSQRSFINCVAEQTVKIAKAIKNTFVKNYGFKYFLLRKNIN